MYSRNGHRIATEEADNHSPIDDIEPEITREELLRDGSLKLLRAINAAFAHLESVLYTPDTTLNEVRIAFWQVAFPLGMSCCEERTMTQMALFHNRQRATISKFATNFCRAQNIPPSVHMKNEDTANAFTNAREKVILCNLAKR
jgi:hypothetical protein